MATQKKSQTAEPEYVSKSEFVRRINRNRQKKDRNLGMFTRPVLDRHINAGSIVAEEFGPNKLIDWNQYGSYPFMELPKYNREGSK